MCAGYPTWQWQLLDDRQWQLLEWPPAGKLASQHSAAVATDILLTQAKAAHKGCHGGLDGFICGIIGILPLLKAGRLKGGAALAAVWGAALGHATAP